MKSGLVISFLLISALTTRGAEIVLRDAATPAGNIVRLGDVAEIRAIDSARAERLASLPLIPAPAPQTQQFIRRRQIEELLQEATLVVPEAEWMDSGGRDGRHTEHFGPMLAEMQYLQRSYPGLSW